MSKEMKIIDAKTRDARLYSVTLEKIDIIFRNLPGSNADKVEALVRYLNEKCGVSHDLLVDHLVKVISEVKELREKQKNERTKKKV